MTRTRPNRHGWHIVACAGPSPCPRPEEGDTDIPVGDDLALVLRGRPLPAADRRVLGAFAAQTAVALQQHRLAEAAAEAAPLAAADRTRTALLSAVSHDLRTPLSSAKAAVTSLRSADVEWSAEERGGAARHGRRVARPADPAGGEPARTSAGCRPEWSASSFGRSASTRSCRSRSTTSASVGHAVQIQVSDDLPAVLADPALLERVVANLVANALRYSPPDQPAARSRRARWPTGSSCGSSTVVPASRRRTVSACSRRSSGSGTVTTPPGSGSAWPCLGDLPSRWVVRSPRRRPPVAG